MGKMFARGYEASRAEKERQDESRANSGKKLYRFFLKNDRDEAEVRFLTEEPVNFYEHTVKEGDKFTTYTCTGDKSTCPLCAEGDKAVYKGAYLIVDKRRTKYTDKKTGEQKTLSDRILLYVQGMRVVSQLDRIHTKYGLSNRDCTIVRLGKGTSTTYTIERGEVEEMSKEEIRNLLPEPLRDKYNGTMDSLMSIVEEQLMMNTKSPIDLDESEEEDDGRERLVSVDDEEPVVKKPKISGFKSHFKKPQSSLKPRAKSMFSKSEEE